MVHTAGPFHEDPVIAVFKRNGDPDPRFSGDGRRVLRTPASDLQVNVAIQRDKILVANNAGTPRLFRLLPNGRLDRSFGISGSVPLGLDHVNALEVDGNGRIVLAGSVPDAAGRAQDFAALRLRRSGRSDPRFGTKGLSTVDFHRDGEVTPSQDYANAVAVRPDGGMVLSGNSSAGTAEQYRDGVVLAALRPDGTLDPAFGEGGRVYAPPEAGGRADSPASAGGAAVAVGLNGNVIFGGTNDRNFTASAYTAFGRPDPFFADDGTTTVDRGSWEDSDALAMGQGGRIYMAGSVWGRQTRDYAVLRLTGTGAADAAFGDDGIAVVDFDHAYDDADGIAVGPGGKILVSGTVGRHRIGVLRLLGD